MSSPVASLNWTFAGVIAAIATAVPQRPAMVHGDQELLWAQLDERGARLAGALHQSGVSPGDVVALYLPNRPEYIEAFLAASRGRLVPMNTNYRYVDDEIVAVWQDADARAVIFDTAFADRVARLRERVPRVRTWIEVGGRDPAVSWSTDYEAALARAAPTPVDFADGDSLVLMYTGGTTGRPKGVMWRQRDLLSLTNSIAARPLPDGADIREIVTAAASRKDGIRALVAAPLMHGFGLYYALSELISSDTVVTLPPISFDPELLLNTVQRLNVKSVGLVGDAFTRPLVQRLDAAPDRWDLSGVRAVVSSGVMWSEAVKAGMLAHMPRARLIDGLGSSEASGIGSASSSAGAVAETARFVPSDRAAVILHDGTLATRGDGRIGRLAVSGWIPLGYLNDPAKTAEVFVEAEGRRWSMPGDMAVLQDDGRIHLLGRGSSCINTGGEKVFPEEVEQVLRRHPGVHDVAVVGVDDDRFGQSIVAVIQPGESVPADAELSAHVRGLLAGYKVPRMYIFVDSLDRQVNGKLDRRTVCALAQERWAARHATAEPST